MKKAYSYIRFSSAIQGQGDSLRRQLSAAQEWAQANGFLIEDDYRDLGLSAYKGNHVTDGALSIFLQKVREGDIEPGAVLIVESLDRLSREQITRAFSQFMEILNAGVGIVTLMDERYYTEKSVGNLTNLMYSLMVMSRAHDESQTKSRRIKAAWRGKMLNAQNKKITRNSPAWLHYNNENGVFELIPERADLVREIFMLSSDGIGKRRIVFDLNQKGIPPWGKGKQWHTSYISKILNNHAARGVFIGQGGEVEVKDYYPAAVDDSLFFKAQVALKSRTNSGGRRGESFSNLFTGLCRCTRCGGAMRLTNKGKPPKGGKYLECASGKAGVGICAGKLKRWRYEMLEGALLFELAGNVDWFAIAGGKESAMLKIREQRDKLTAEMSSVETALTNYDQLILSASAETIKRISIKYDELEQRRAKIESELKRIAIDIKGSDSRRIDDEFAEVLVKLSQAESETKKFQLRAQVNQLLKSAISVIYFDPEQNTISYKTVDNDTLKLVSASSEHTQIWGEIAEILTALKISLRQDKKEETSRHRMAVLKKLSETWRNPDLLKKMWKPTQ